MKNATFFLTASLFLSLTANANLNLSEKIGYRMQALTNVFENSTTEFQYGYIENIHDGRGYTAGRVGFTTATGDLVEVVERYSQSNPKNALVKYLPELHRLAQAHSPATHRLAGFKKAWMDAATDILFLRTQDRCVNDIYFQPALKWAGKLGLRIPLVIALVYDTIIQHGEGDDPDGLEALISRTNRNMNGSPADGVDEIKWFYEFARVRERDLLNPSDVATAKEWRKSVGRVYCFLDLARRGHWSLEGHVTVDVFGFQGELP